VVWLLPAALAVVALVVAQRSRFIHAAGSALFVLYLIAIGVIEFWPLQFDVSLRRLRHGNWMPFQGSIGMARSTHPLAQFVGGRDFLANILLFAPVGVLLPLVIGRRKRASIIVGLALLVVLAFALEFAQGIAVNRTFDIDDPISASIGALAGVAVGLIVAALAGTP
jgi:glycopeptide antibiotics resistance protein